MSCCSEMVSSKLNQKNAVGYQMRGWCSITFALVVAGWGHGSPQVEQEAGDTGRSVPVLGLCTKLWVGGSVVHGMVISTVGFLIIGIICSPSFSPAN